MPTYSEMCDRLRQRGRDAEQVMRSAPPEAIARIEANEPIRTGLCRVAPFVRAAAPADDVHGDGLTITGYGAVFNSPTRIESWEGEFDEEITPGAFRKSLRETTPIMQFDHGKHPLLGGLPLGKWSRANEDDHGLALEGRMFDNWLTVPFADAIRQQGVTGMSFRFSVVRDQWVDARGQIITDPNELGELLFYGAGDRGPLKRKVQEVKCSEVGPVVWPAYRDTSVSARSAGTLVIDLAAVRGGDRREAAYAIATLEAEMTAGERTADATDGTPAGQDPAERFAPYGVEALRNMAANAARERSANTDAVRHTDRVDTSAAPTPTEIEPSPTGSTAATHPDTTSAPRSTEAEPAGQHSSSQTTDQDDRPRNPTARRKGIRSEYREVLTRALALPKD
jgi:HK97 family phage prohead protease